MNQHAPAFMKKWHFFTIKSPQDDKDLCLDTQHHTGYCAGLSHAENTECPPIEDLYQSGEESLIWMWNYGEERDKKILQIMWTSASKPRLPPTWLIPGTIPQDRQCTWDTPDLFRFAKHIFCSGNFELMLCECWMREGSLQESSMWGFPCAKLSPSYCGQPQCWNAHLDIQPASCFRVVQEWLRWKPICLTRRKDVWLQNPHLPAFYCCENHHGAMQLSVKPTTLMMVPDPVAADQEARSMPRF